MCVQTHAAHRTSIILFVCLPCPPRQFVSSTHGPTRQCALTLFCCFCCTVATVADCGNYTSATSSESAAQAGGLGRHTVCTDGKAPPHTTQPTRRHERFLLLSVENVCDCVFAACGVEFASVVLQLVIRTHVISTRAYRKHSAKGGREYYRVFDCAFYCTTCVWECCATLIFLMLPLTQRCKLVRQEYSTIT